MTFQNGQLVRVTRRWTNEERQRLCPTIAWPNELDRTLGSIGRVSWSSPEAVRVAFIGQESWAYLAPSLEAISEGPVSTDDWRDCCAHQ